MNMGMSLSQEKADNGDAYVAEAGCCFLAAASHVIITSQTKAACSQAPHNHDDGSKSAMPYEPTGYVSGFGLFGWFGWERLLPFYTDFLHLA